jgi:hypothetical protein
MTSATAFSQRNQAIEALTRRAVNAERASVELDVIKASSHKHTNDLKMLDQLYK